MSNIHELTRGRWPDILAQLGGLSSKQLTDEHQPCPCCGGEDRYRFDNLNEDGTWFCNQCGGKDGRGGAGSGIDLLMRVQKWDFSTTVRNVEQFLGVTRQRPQAPIRGAESVWWYTDDFAVCRFPEKVIRPIHWDGDRWVWKQPPRTRPLLNLDRLRSNPDAFVLVVEGEKTADAAARLFPSFVVTTWPGGCKATAKADWRPLNGRKVALWPDNDAVGLQAMQKVAGLIHAERLRLVRNPEDAPEGWDLADADWDTAQAMAWLRENNYELDAAPPAVVEEPIEEPPAAQSEPEPYFRILGYDRETYFYSPRGSQQVVELSASGHTKLNLMRLAPLRYWELNYPKENSNGCNWDAAADDLINTAHEVGIFDPTRLRGRGAWWDNGQVVLHLGSRLVVNGRPQTSMTVGGSRYIYERSVELPGFREQEISDDDALMVLTLAQEFSWEVPASGQLLAGWITLAPFCGAMPWRPHAWITGGAGTGKSTVMKTFVRGLLGGNCHIAQASTTEAGIRALLGCDAIPVVFDEADGSEDGNGAAMARLLGFIRAASSDDSGSIIKGRADGGHVRYEARAMFCLASINAPVARKSDQDRFCLLSLRKDTSRDWAPLQRALADFITPETGRALAARTVKLIPVIRENTRSFATALARTFGQRFGDQYGALLAGAYSLTCRELITADEAEAWVADMDWESYGPEGGDSDERQCIDYLLQTQVPVDGYNFRAQIGELVQVAMMAGDTPPQLAQLPQQHAVSILGRNGFKVTTENGARYLAVSNNCKEISGWLRTTRWADAYSRTLRRLPGAVKGGPLHFVGIGTQRCTLVPLSSLIS